jgi:protein-disulfide isomerase
MCSPIRPKIAPLLLAILLIPACGPTPEDVSELREQQRTILAKLDGLEKKIDQMAARPAAPAPAAAPRRGPDPERVYELPVGASAIKGPEDAPVTIIEFSDYQCPFCARSEPLIAEVMAAYPTQVRFVYKHYPLTSIHPNAMGAARAAVAAQRQGKFWEYHDILFANSRELQEEKLLEYAQRIGLDMEKFKADMSSKDVESIVTQDVRLAQKSEVRGTPTIFVNGKILQNRSLEGFKQQVDAALAAKS